MVFVDASMSLFYLSYNKSGLMSDARQKEMAPAKLRGASAAYTMYYEEQELESDEVRNGGELLKRGC
jgi:hypothetical protein